MSFFTRLISLKKEKESGTGTTTKETDAEFARRIGVSKVLIGQWRLIDRAGRTGFVPKDHVLERISTNTNRRKSWLAYGEGPEFVCQEERGVKPCPNSLSS